MLLPGPRLHLPRPSALWKCGKNAALSLRRSYGPPSGFRHHAKACFLVDAAEYQLLNTISIETQKRRCNIERAYSRFIHCYTSACTYDLSRIVIRLAFTRCPRRESPRGTETYFWSHARGWENTTGLRRVSCACCDPWDHCRAQIRTSKADEVPG